MNTIKFGTKVEKIIIKKLNQNGINAILTPPIMKGIDGLIIKDKHTSWPIQIKGRKDFEGGQYVPNIKNFYSNFFVIVYSDKSKNFWIIPSKTYKKISNVKPKRLSYTKKTNKALKKYENMKGINYLKTCLKSR
jgi:hypothetical protein